MNRLDKGQPPVIYGDGTQIRDFVFVEDVAEANLKAMQSNVKNGFFNIGTGKATSIRELAEIMIGLYGFAFEPIFSPPLEGDIKLSQADITLTKKMLSWESKTSLRDGLSNIIK
jgi:UDP-glucose 4-epimerase